VENYCYATLAFLLCVALMAMQEDHVFDWFDLGASLCAIGALFLMVCGDLETE
jgi:hypothetical protein